MAGTKVKVKTAWGSKTKNSSITISAKTLGGALKELEKRDEWGKFAGKIDYAYKADAKKNVTEVTLKPSYTIQMPKWTGYSKAPKECQQEWDRMWKKLEEHEEEHRKIHEQCLKNIQDHLGTQTDYPVDLLKTDMTHMAEHGQAQQDAFDATTGHGSKAGVSLNVSAACA
jgi:predicted secreted Zn-dependent protease